MSNQTVPARKKSPKKRPATAAQAKKPRVKKAAKKRRAGTLVTIGGVEVLILPPKVKSTIPLAEIRRAVKAAKASRAAREMEK
ncbi:MAG TPA: hypothetical protein VM165_05365 [Planctomycetaceae bacterium]|nr:hypothetical protein [Planctomycetaceae bacterium]